MKIGKQKIRCRNCGSLLAINVKEENINKSLRCPVCKNIAPLVQFELETEKDCDNQVIANEKERRTGQDFLKEQEPAGDPYMAKEQKADQNEEIESEKSGSEKNAANNEVSKEMLNTNDDDDITRPKIQQEQPGHNTETEQPSGVEGKIGMLVIKNSNKIYQLKAGCNIIGRNGEGTKAHFKIDTPNERRISREHIVIEVLKDGNCTNHITKLYKREVNTTYINTTRLEYGDSVILKDGDNIELPGVTLQFIIP